MRGKFRFIEFDFPLRLLEAEISALSHPIIQAASIELLSTAKRIDGVHLLAPILVGVAGRVQGAYSRANFEVHQKGLPTKEERALKESEVVGKMLGYVSQDVAEDKASNHETFWEDAFYLWEHVLYWFDQVEEPVRSMHELLIIGCWGAIESCIGSVWDNLIDSKHTVVSARSGQELRIVSLFESRTGTPSSGKVYSKPGKEKLKSVQVMREAFGRGFSVDYADIDDVMASEPLEALALTRNLLAHKQGRIDSDFAKRAPYISNLKRFFNPPVTHIKLDAALVGTLMTEGLTACVKLLKLIDRWLAKHP